EDKSHQDKEQGKEDTEDPFGTGGPGEVIEFVQTEIGKNTGKRDTNKKKHFLQRQVHQKNSSDITVVEAPVPRPGEKAVPDKIGNGHQYGSCQKGGPVSVELYTGMKGKNKGDADGEKVHEQVKVVHEDFRFLRYFKGTQSIPKLSPSSLVRDRKS